MFCLNAETGVELEIGVLVRTREFADSSKILLSSFWLTSFDLDDVARLFLSDWRFVESMFIEWACDDVAADFDDDVITTVLVTLDEDVMVWLLLWIFSADSVWLAAVFAINVEVRLVRDFPTVAGDCSASSVMVLARRKFFLL